jgi:hypothetical protein
MVRSIHTNSFEIIQNKVDQSFFTSSRLVQTYLTHTMPWRHKADWYVRNCWHVCYVCILVYEVVFLDFWWIRYYLLNNSCGWRKVIKIACLELNQQSNEIKVRLLSNNRFLVLLKCMLVTYKNHWNLFYIQPTTFSVSAAEFGGHNQLLKIDWSTLMSNDHFHSLLKWWSQKITEID